jgi:hypothetical protein
MFKLIIFSILSTTLYASTEFLFVREDIKKMNGKCYEVDSKSKGKNYKAKVNIEKCKPKQTDHLFNFADGRCYLIDTETGGYNYIESLSDTRRCKTSGTSIGITRINNTSSCYEYDKPSHGKKYFKKLSSKDCLKTSDTFVWVSKKKFQGDCFQKGSLAEGSALNKVKSSYCRPEVVTYTFLKNDSDFFRGKCYETHPENPANYSKSIKNELCKPKNTVYIFYTPENKKTGKCFEIDALTKGEKYIDTVSDSFCKDNL